VCENPISNFRDAPSFQLSPAGTAENYPDEMGVLTQGLKSVREN